MDNVIIGAIILFSLEKKELKKKRILATPGAPTTK